MPYKDKEKQKQFINTIDWNSMKKWSKKDRKVIKDPKCEVVGPKRKKQKKSKPYLLMYMMPLRSNSGWRPTNAGTWQVYSKFAKKEDRDREYRKNKNCYAFWEWKKVDAIEEIT